MRIPLFQVHMAQGISQGLEKVLYSGQIANGPNVETFESLLQEYIGNPYITSTGDISTSITMCLFMAGVRPGSEVITSPMACLSTNMPILNLFAKVSWCDIDPLTGNIDPVFLEKIISPKTKAIVVYHWGGNPSDLDKIYNLAKRYNVPIIEDAGEALGAEYRGQRIGATGTDFTVFSFYPNRQITTGEGAAVAFGNADSYERGRWLKRYGIHQPSFRDEWEEISPTSEIRQGGYNSYMNHIAATIGVAQMPYLPEIVAKHQANGRFYDEALRNIPGITILNRVTGTEAAFWIYTFLAERRDDLLKHLRGRGIYASKVHLRNDLYACFGENHRELPGVDYFDQYELSIPCGWWVTPEDIDYIVESICMGW